MPEFQKIGAPTSTSPLGTDGVTSLTMCPSA